MTIVSDDIRTKVDDAFTGVDTKRSRCACLQ